MQDKISVYGGTGFIGSNFINLYPDRCVLVPRGERVPPTNTILYFISTTHNYHVFDNLHKDVNTNLKVLLEVLECCKDRDVTINFVSSWFVYGNTPLPARENSPCDPRGFYSITKRCAEQLVESYCKTFKKDYRILRLGNVYGVGDKGASKKKNALQYLVNNLKEDKTISLYHGGEFIRDYLHVIDTCRAINIVMNIGEKCVYNIGSGHPYRFRDLIEYAIHKLNSKSKVLTTEPPDFHQLVQVKDMYLDVRKLKSLGFQPELSIEEGMNLLCQN